MAKTYASAYPPDTGCNLAPSCLACPLPLCKYDTPKQVHPTRRKGEGAIVEAVNSGMARRVAAQTFGVSLRTIDRVLARNRPC